jgi:hypothetical protein
MRPIAWLCLPSGIALPLGIVVWGPRPRAPLLVLPRWSVMIALLPGGRAG